jgi:hypothetical protein
MLLDELQTVTCRGLQSSSPSGCTSESLASAISASAWLENMKLRFVDNMSFQISRPGQSAFISLTGEDSKADLDIPIPSLRHLERSLQRPPPDTITKTDNATIYGGVTLSSGTKTVSGKGVQVKADKSVILKQSLGARSASVIPFSSNSASVKVENTNITVTTNASGDKKVSQALSSQMNSVASNHTSTKIVISGVADVIDGVRISSLFRRGLFLASKCPHQSSFGDTKRARAIQRCKYFGAWMERHRLFKQGVLEGTNLYPNYSRITYLFKTS